MPRRGDEPYVQWKITLPASLAARVEIQLMNPTFGKPHYGSRARLVEELIRLWLSGDVQISHEVLTDA